MTKHQKEKIYQAGYENLKSEYKAKILGIVINELAIFLIVAYCIYRAFTQEKSFLHMLAIVLIVLSCTAIGFTIKVILDFNRLKKSYLIAANYSNLKIVLNTNGCQICEDDDSIITELSLDKISEIAGFTKPVKDPDDGKTKLLPINAKANISDLKIQETDELFTERQE